MGGGEELAIILRPACGLGSHIVTLSFTEQKQDISNTKAGSIHTSTGFRVRRRRVVLFLLTLLLSLFHESLVIVFQEPFPRNYEWA